jgi:hypothetical protein
LLLLELELLLELLLLLLKLKLSLASEVFKLQSELLLEGSTGHPHPPLHFLLSFCCPLDIFVLLLLLLLLSV